MLLHAEGFWRGATRGQAISRRSRGTLAAHQNSKMQLRTLPKSTPIRTRRTTRHSLLRWLPRGFEQFRYWFCGPRKHRRQVMKTLTAKFGITVAILALASLPVLPNI